MKELTIGTMYKSARDGFVEYRGIDRYCGETTMMFLTEDGRTRYLYPKEVDEGYLVEPESPEVAELKAQLATVTAQRDALVEINRGLLAALEAIAFEDGAGPIPTYDEIRELIAKAKGGAA